MGPAPSGDQRGSRLGPVALTGTVARLPDRVEDPDKAYSTRAELLAGLHARRDDQATIALTASLSLPTTMAPYDIVGFEIARTFSTLHYALSPRKDDPNYALLESAVQAGQSGANVATVTYRVPLVAVPWIGAFGGGLLTTSAKHREVVDPYRHGLPTAAFDPRACNA